VEALRAGHVDGILYFSVEPAPGGPGGEHVVVIESSPEGLPWVRLDTEAGTDAALAHLLELGHRRIAHLGSRLSFPTFEIRTERWRAALEGAGIEPSPDLRATALIDFDDAARGAGELLDRPDPPTAIFCDDDILAGGVYLAARERGLRIPEDLSVVGFDDLDFAHVLTPPLTTVSADAERLGATAFESLAAGMRGEQVPGKILPVELVVRESTAPPRG
jgi:DNA-binding LacI/PurR family transcriptional regulator